MKENKVTGWQKVFAFTFLQNFKSPVQIVTTAILCAFALLSMPLLTMLQGMDIGAETKKETSIEQLLIVDETELSLSDWLDLSAMEFDGVLPKEILFTERSYEELTEELAKAEEGKTAVIQVAFSEEAAFRILGTYGSGTQVTEEDVLDLVDLIAVNLQSQLITQLGISDEQVEYLNREVVTQVSYYQTGEDGKGDIVNSEEPEEEEGLISMAEYGVIMSFLLVVTFMVSINGEQVASAVVAEKSSKVVEYLLISVKPLALLVGKVLAVFVMTCLQLILIIICFFVSNAVYLALNPSVTTSLLDMMNSALSAGGESIDTASLSLGMLPLGILILLGGTLFFSAIAGLAGACVSRSEELSEAMKLYSVCMVIGAYMGLGVVMADMTGTAPEAFKMITALVPVSSMFIVPGYLLLGRMSWKIGLLSFGIMLVCLILLFRFAANIYEVLIYHKGNPIKFKDLLRINKESRKKKSA